MTDAAMKIQKTPAFLNRKRKRAFFFIVCIVIKIFFSLTEKRLDLRAFCSIFKMKHPISTSFRIDAF
ncbi:MAG: hypothetical protein EAZ92_16495 [Candidatus Kapaibacterium sp.]|nr:MAG: hypothetical protein EAZ92_16495 [Candidatus Kapabacteria bacterium]